MTAPAMITSLHKYQTNFLIGEVHTLELSSVLWHHRETCHVEGIGPAKITRKTAPKAQLMAVLTYLFTQTKTDRQAETIPGSDSVERTHMVWFAMPVIVKMWSVGNFAAGSSANMASAAARCSLTLNFTSLLPLWQNKQQTESKTTL